MSFLGSEAIYDLSHYDFIWQIPTHNHIFYRWLNCGHVEFMITHRHDKNGFPVPKWWCNI